ncbi:hypothetical protein FSARC_3683 [Fusarium sarcochroum]|uniref:Secreted protein CSS2 C-terminal domain-containing protein n=1 Tax=Fusarium sarcochroum TaxID=1208366 RepID=A0A8H4U3M0_9HYPO|nr:hypothetical protein FSARC_3683 [Fusarium sarcochroum]
MTSPHGSETDTVQKFIRATAAYVIPLLLLVANLFAYLDKNETKPYEILASNILMSVQLLGVYLLGQGATSPVSGNTAVHAEDSESEKPAVEERGNTCRKILALAASHKSTIPIDWSTAKIERCGYFSGNAGPNDEIHYEYHAAGKHCDTTAEKATITECLDLTYGGPWNGYLLIGPSEGFDYKAYCGPKLNLQTCDSRGKSDLH